MLAGEANNLLDIDGQKTVRGGVVVSALGFSCPRALALHEDLHHDSLMTRDLIRMLLWTRVVFFKEGHVFLFLKCLPLFQNRLPPEPFPGQTNGFPRELENDL